MPCSTCTRLTGVNSTIESYENMRGLKGNKNIPPTSCFNRNYPEFHTPCNVGRNKWVAFSKMKNQRGSHNHKNKKIKTCVKPLNGWTGACHQREFGVPTSMLCS